MIQKYLDLKNKFLSLETALQDPVVINNQEKLKTASSEYTDLKPVCEKILTLEKIETELIATEKLSQGTDEMAEMARTELNSLKLVSKSSVL